MKRASYRHAIEQIALNDSPGDLDALEVSAVESLVTVALVADLFGTTTFRVATDVVRFRKGGR